MNLHEYQAKALLNDHGVSIQEGIAVENIDDALKAADELNAKTGTDWFVVKAQIHAGGRGKGTVQETGSKGVVIAKGKDELPQKVKDIIGGTLVTIQTGPAGKKVNKVLIAQDVYYPGESEIEEYYISILLDRSKGKNVIMYSTEGGMDIEEVAKKTPHLIFKEWIEPGIGIQGFQVRKVAFNLGLSGNAFKECTKLVTKLYRAYESIDASMIEINPLLKTSDNKIIAVDSKINIDESALYRHKDLAELRDLSEEDPTEVEAGKHHLNFVKLEGNVGCMVNGAGLAMATMDIIKLSGGEPANFLDVGGNANATTVEAGFRIIMKDPNVKAILINVFGGIVRCDRVAQGVIDAYNNIGEINIPIIVRLQGTNAEIAKKLIDDSGLKVSSAIQLKDAAELVEKTLKS
ncbi:MAG TPA: ADP-forming succinate--CoA ligase subunit beta [Bacteroidetes bacterium]|nr:ADP-forming succinate--CoA ligase subunit beta [Bacteroidota bacterium]